MSLGAQPGLAFEAQPIPRLRFVFLPAESDRLSLGRGRH